MKKRFRVIIRILICMIVIMGLLLVERMGIRYDVKRSSIELLPVSAAIRNKPLQEEKTCLFITDSSETNSIEARLQFEQILIDMRVSYDEVDVVADEIPDFAAYKTVLVGCVNLSPIGDKILDLTSYVYKGGRVMFGLPMEKDTTLDVIASKLGIIEHSYSFHDVADFKSSPDFMLGWQRVYRIDDSYESSMEVALSSSCKVYASTADDSVPLIWSSDYGEGRFVVCNFGYCEKSYRGIYASAYSLLEDVCVYPVINAADFYLDDFPSPVPSGNSEYIMRDYRMDTAEFYSYVWWPDVLKIAGEHGFPLTGVVIETYEDDTSEDIKSNGSTADFYYFGNMLLNRGGEIGYHGYNHQPLCGPDYEYLYDEGYKVWESAEAMKKAMEEVTRFVGSLYLSQEACVYVPPSNVLSEEGRQLIVSSFPGIRTIASIYLPGENSYPQEYEVKEDGMVEAPRIISGCEIGDYMMMTAFSELNMHFVSSHFMHPDDLLDEDRGAAIGWETLKEGYNGYMDYLDEVVPDIRKVTGRGFAGAVQRYSNLCVEKEDDDEGCSVHLDGLIDDAYMIVRINKGVSAGIKGAEVVQLAGNLYLIRVKDENVRINTKR
ncbi:DUF2194 domain-containing protein [Butyrivibrio sp. MC2013]|uniref:DUF2194 domain-containing protein n=1 Tax=Butyrivibrio sp. MC2013 TaxID=1280686 RepID=UPI0003F63EAC|nr:DUF2194 domain-containing protein [Butyrivibrio sp. MC2013]